VSQIEPSADLRQFAYNMRQMHAALTAEGFTDSQALVIIGQVLAASVLGGGAQ
jgi:hypothetical protein